MVPSAPRCPKCQRSSTSEVMRRFRLTHEEPGAARGEVEHWWICDYCGHEWEGVSKKRWDSVHGASARNPTEYRARVDKYAKRLYNRVFDYPAGSFKDDMPGFLKLVGEYGGRIGTRYGGRVGTEVGLKYTLRAANKLLAHWDDPVNLKYDILKALKSRSSGRGRDD